ncbi:MAG: ABC transporter, permease protein 2 (cluster 5, nickel/peptides/opines) [uncultured Thermomicrobiales bacterium]|uniref:ABC transporter, permease protein 2 (Cluster 5, nickel/peptides/opines) n=2 Tax=uncultured Thermomicrobiales bacterium TaxID=1645740 RepID=A0A6J4V1S8_9BACT|nr:MAG: ABC transporter, permease protein 2 (cluster 5, nickel/peptides/opines) [uncultured Thermomicrobiales bacterium]
MDRPLTDPQTAAPGTLPDSNRLEQLEEERRATTGSRFWRRLRSERKALVGALFVAALIVVAILGPMIAPHDPDADDFMLFESPSMDHPFGTDSFGRDLFSRIVVGARTSVTIGFAAAAVAMVIGVALGLLAGYYGGWIDTVISRCIDLLWAFPVIILTVGLVAVFGAGARNVVIAIAIAYIDDFARVVRAKVLSLREEDYTLAARAVGASDRRIMFRHILPNSAAPIIVQATFAVGLGILAESGLSFLGLGVNPTTPTWGLSLNEGRDFVRQAWWISVFPGLAIVFTVLALNLFGDGLRDALDVRSVGEA